MDSSNSSNPSRARQINKGRRILFSLAEWGWILPVFMLGVLLALTVLVWHVARAPNWALWTWLVGSIIFVLSCWQAIHYRRANEHRLKNHLHALEMLAKTSAAILGKVGSSGEIWKQSCEAASSLMSMSLASVCVLSEDGQSLRFIATHGVDPPLIGTVLRTEEAPTASICIATRKPYIVGDLNLEKGKVNRPLATRYGLRSILQVPLKIGDRIIGVMMLGDRRPRQFSRSDIRVAELWGMLAAVAIANDQLYNQTAQAVAARDRLLNQQERVFSVVNDMIAKHGSTEQVLESIVELAPEPLGMDLCQVSLITDTPGEMQIAAMTRKYGHDLVGYRYRIEGSGSGVALKSEKMFVVEDGGPDNNRLHADLRQRVPCGSALFCPMKSSESKPIGILVLLREKPGVFSPAQLSMAQLLAIRAATAIENARLYERTRQDADTKETLLRELNHRVKNNLAGIIALLSMDQPQMSPRTRAWLNRVIDRVRNLARTHQMLSDSVERVTLQELIDQTLKSLAVVKPAEVVLVVNLEQPNILLRIDRAVSVAMVLHELCYNALVHGLAGHGQLTVTGALADRKELTLEVIDNGCGFQGSNCGGNGGGSGEHSAQAARGNWPDYVEPSRPPEKPVAEAVAVLQASRSGLGLNLVRDFVGRELHGNFSIFSPPGGGTTARVVFALLEDEAPRV